MTQIEFEQDQLRTKSRIEKPSLLARTILKTGIVRTTTGVNIVLLIIIALSITLAFLMNTETGSIGDKYGNYEEFKLQNPELFPE